MDNARAIQILREARQKIVDDSSRQLSEIDRSIQSLQKEAGLPATLEEHIAVKPGQYRSMKGTGALIAYLSERPGLEISIPKALAELQIGGAFLGKDPKRHERNLKIGISNNSRIFAYNEETNTVKLIPGAGPRLRKRKPTKA